MVAAERLAVIPVTALRSDVAAVMRPLPEISPAEVAVTRLPAALTVPVTTMLPLVVVLRLMPPLPPVRLAETLIFILLVAVSVTPALAAVKTLPLIAKETVEIETPTPELVSTLPPRVVVPEPAVCENEAAVIAAALTSLAPVMEIAPRRVPPPIAPLNVMFPVALRARSFPPSMVWPKLMKEPADIWVLVVSVTCPKYC